MSCETKLMRFVELIVLQILIDLEEKEEAMFLQKLTTNNSKVSIPVTGCAVQICISQCSSNKHCYPAS
jgi:hypothetical protein